jgi:hypothetical protein
VIRKQDTYLVRHHSDSPYTYSKADIKGMLRISLSTNCPPLLAELFVCSNEAEFVQKLLQDNNKKPSTIHSDISMMSYQLIGSVYSPRHLILPLVFPGVRVSLIFTVLWIVPFV